MEIKWNFNGVRQDKFFGTQADWNQNLLTTINEFDIQRLQAGYKQSEPITEIKSPEKFKPIFKSLKHYNESSSIIANLYYINFCLEDSESCLLFPNDYKIIIENYNPKIYQ